MRKVDVARAYREKYGWEMPTRKLARIMYKENNLLFKDCEEARAYLRAIEGKYSTTVKVDRHVPPRPMNPYNLPDSNHINTEPFIMPYHDRIGVINDVHVPYHDVAALTAAISFLKRNEVQALLLNGDIIDMHQLSFYERDPNSRRFSEELDMLIKTLDVLSREITPVIYYKFGNHEYRYDRYLNMKAYEIADLDDFSLTNIIKKRFDCHIIEAHRIVVCNGLPYVHGHEFGRSVFNPVNAARGLFLQSKHSAVKGDSHTTSEHTEPDLMGKIMTTYSVGCLCNLKPKWRPINKWNHGVAIQHNKKEDEYYFENRRIYKGEII